jgi:hypothetical protein
MLPGWAYGGAIARIVRRSASATRRDQSNQYDGVRPMKNDTPAWFTHVTLGAWNPEGCLVSVIDDPSQAVRAVEALRAAGFTD